MLLLPFARDASLRRLLLRFSTLFGLCLALISCGGGYDGILEESLAGSIQFSAINVSTDGARARADSDAARMDEVAPAVKSAIEARLKGRMAANAAHRLSVQITYVDIPSQVTTGMGLYRGRLNGEARVIGPDGSVLATTAIQAAPKAQGPNNSSVQGVPVGLLLSAVATAATKPDGLPNLAAAFAQETSRAVVGR